MASFSVYHCAMNYCISFQILPSCRDSILSILSLPRGFHEVLHKVFSDVFHEVFNEVVHKVINSINEVVQSVS